MAIKDVTSFTYVLEVLGEGFQSMQSVPMVSSYEALETLHNHHMKGGNTFFKQAINELLTKQPAIA
jgi:hypothetical protein